MTRPRSSFAGWAAAVVAVGCGAVALAAFLRLDTPPLSAASPRVASHDSATAVVPPLEAFGAFWDLDLQRPLVDLPAKTESPDPAPPPSLPVLRLVGTVIEPGHSVAFFETAPGSTEMKKAGDKIGGVMLLRIDADHVEVAWRGESVVLKIVPSSPLPVATSAAPVPASPRPLPEPGPDGIIHLFTTSDADPKAATPPPSPR